MISVCCTPSNYLYHIRWQTCTSWWTRKNCMGRIWYWYQSCCCWYADVIPLL